jgi:type IV pilus assembly protein PilV
MNTRKQQTGVMLLEALISILIFSIGILAIIGLQAAAVRASSDAKYRSEASLLTSQLVGQMSVSDRTSATLITNFQGGAGCGVSGAAYVAWLADVTATLPGVVANPPTVCIVAGATAGSVATITVFWLLPSDTGAAHQYRTIVPII